MIDDELADQFEGIDIDASQWRDAAPLRAIASAMIVADAAERNLLDVVAAARSADMSWTEIAGMLGVSSQAAEERFGERVAARQAGRLVEDQRSARVRLCEVE